MLPSNSVQLSGAFPKSALRNSSALRLECYQKDKYKQSLLPSNAAQIRDAAALSLDLALRLECYQKT